MSENKMLESVSGRNPDGTFAPGNMVAGMPKPYRYALRAALLEQELTAEEIIALDNDDKALLKRPAIDAIVIRRLARALTKITPESCADVERAADSHLDRTEGKPKGDSESGMGDTFNLVINLGNDAPVGKTIDNMPPLPVVNLGD